MAGFVSQQPNGRYCRFSTFVDCPTHINMTAEDYINHVANNKEAGEDVIKHYVHPFSEVANNFQPNNMTQEQFEKLIKTMESKPTKWSEV